jgi:hypothetical protein
MHVTRPPLVPLVHMIISFTPIHLVFGSLRDVEDKQFLFEKILDPESRIGNELLDLVADRLVQEWFWMPRWTVQEIWWRAMAAWSELDGELSMRGVNLMSMPPAQATNTVKAVLRKWASADKDAAEELQRDLTTEPPRIVLRHRTEETTPEAIEAEGYDFMAALELAKQHQR